MGESTRLIRLDVGLWQKRYSIRTHCVMLIVTLMITSKIFGVKATDCVDKDTTAMHHLLYTYAGSRPR